MPKKKTKTPSTKQPLRFAVLQSRYYAAISDGLLHGVVSYLQEVGCPLAPGDLFQAPGAFEMPLLAKKLAESKRYSGVICLGCVVEGETAHFDFIAQAASLGIQTASLDTGVPIAFGILTAFTEKQAVERSQDNEHNKGREAADACYHSAKSLLAWKKK